MLKLAGRKFALSLGLAVTLALSSIASGWGTLDHLIVVAPNCVWAGQTINGYVAGGHTPMSVSSSSLMGCLPPLPCAGPADPLFFCIPTWEPQIGSIVTIIGGDPTGACATATVLII